MHHRISHDYGRVNFRVVWKTVQDDLPPLIAELEKYLERRRVASELARKIHGLPPDASGGVKITKDGRFENHYAIS